jgi:two-component system, NarL family, nitrate/nitrite response regulator NarL
LHAQLNIAIVSQNEIEREGLRRILTEQAFTVIGVHRNPAELGLDRFSDSPDILPLVIVDTTTEDHGLETCRYVHARWPDCKIVVMAADCQSQMVAEAFHAGIDGYVGKHISCASLTEMLKLVALGEKMIPSQVIFDLASLKSDRGMSEMRVSTGDANLSDREVEILRGLIRGEPNKVISRRLTVTEATVKVHVKSILRKLGVMNRTQAAIWGMSRGLTDMSAAIVAPMAAQDGEVAKHSGIEGYGNGRAYLA